MHSERAKLTIIAIPLVLFAATVGVSVMVSEDAYARDGRYSGDSTSQAAAVNNECLNSILDFNTIDNMVGVGNCGGTVSQQHESGQASAPITSQTADPTIELQRATTTQPPLTATPVENCAACFSTLTTAEQSQFLNRVNDFFPTVDTSMGFADVINQLCELFETAAENDDLPQTLELLDDLLTESPPIVDETTSLRIQGCITRAL
ncbi:MAG: hypothetical protein ACRD8Z_17510 [Nitrososphaeraceae archaeon]